MATIRITVPDNAMSDKANFEAALKALCAQYVESIQIDTIFNNKFPTIVNFKDGDKVGITAILKHCGFNF